METKKDLFEGTSGNYYEPKSARQAALMKMVLDIANVPYQTVTQIVSKNQEFDKYFVEKVDDHWMQNRVIEIELSIEMEGKSDGLSGGLTLDKEGGSSSGTGGGFKPSFKKQFEYELGQKQQGTYKWDKEV